MTQEDKNLLLKDLCARLLYWPHVKTVDGDDAYIVGLDDTEEGLFYVHILEDGDSYDTIMQVENFKPYLRPMSSMTEKEKDDYENYTLHWLDKSEYGYASGMVDYLNQHHFDHRGLIPMGLALEAPKGMYKTE